MIKVENLKFCYPKQAEETIKGISFAIPEGAIYGFLGPSGAGKSTTQKILTRLLDGYSGKISIMGKDLKMWRNNYFNHIGVGFELPNHYSKLTGLENLKLFSSLYSKPVGNLMELLAKVGLEDAANKKAGDYSKGMKMRLNFARALVHNPDILFFDEPTSGLDPVNARNLKNIIKELKAQGKTIFITTHNMFDADELCDRVAFISNGLLMAEDSPKALKLKYGKPLLNIEYRNKELENREINLDGIGQNKDFLNIINKYEIVSMHTREASLNEVFAITTGQELTKIEG